MYVYDKNVIWANLLSNPLLFLVLWAENFEIYLATLVGCVLCGKQLCVLGIRSGLVRGDQNSNHGWLIARIREFYWKNESSNGRLLNLYRFYMVFVRKN